MKTQTFNVESPMMLTAFIKANIFGAGYAFCKTVLKNKDIKINGVRTGADVLLAKGDIVQVFYSDDAIKSYNPYTTIFEDDNIIVVFKNQGIEVTSPQNKNTLEELINKKRNGKQDRNKKENNNNNNKELTGENLIVAAHRLDVNTEGLVMFAKNEKTASELRAGFENGWIDKYYLALCFGTLNNSPLTLTGFLKKNARTGIVEISKEKTPGAQAVKTVVSFVKSIGDFSLLKIKAVTGRTHQIRAHLASIKLYIVGDGKYGNTKMNNIYGYNKQCLCASSLNFAFPSSSFLSYLNTKKLEVTPSFLK